MSSYSLRVRKLYLVFTIDALNIVFSGGLRTRVLPVGQPEPPAAPGRVLAWLKPNCLIAGFSRGPDWTDNPTGPRGLPALGESL